MVKETLKMCRKGNPIGLTISKEGLKGITLWETRVHFFEERVRNKFCLEGV